MTGSCPFDSAPPLWPKICNLCGGKVVYTSNAVVYGREYGSGRCYLCTQCGAFVGTHRPWPREALGILADKPMRELKVVCHGLFDAYWKGKPKARKKREDLYAWLAGQLGIPLELCHFGYFDLKTLERAFAVLKVCQGKQMRYDSKGRIYFE